MSLKEKIIWSIIVIAVIFMAIVCVENPSGHYIAAILVINMTTLFRTWYPWHKDNT